MATMIKGMSSAGFIRGYITAHEGVLSLNPADNGNWYDPARYAAGLPQRRNMGKLVGSKFGVTAYALAAYSGRTNITAADIAAITLDLAVAIGTELFFHRPGFDRLAWNRVTASIVDKGWGSGPGTATRLMQRMIGVLQDGSIGPKTQDAFAAFIAAHGEDGAATIWAGVRDAFDHALATNEGPNDPDRIFYHGWLNRTASFLPGTRWWAQWSAAA
jgi:lysozyme family protein